MFSRFFRRSASADAAAKAYDSIVEQSRHPDFYTRYGVADTLDGRFDLLVLHTSLVLIRLKGEEGESEAFAQALFDTLFTDMDQSLREIGVSDMSIGKKVKQMGRAFYGRLEAYEAGLSVAENEGTAVLSDALARNLFRSGEEAAADVGEMASYTLRQAAHLAAQDSVSIAHGQLTFAAP
ncbi:ubiquinol-cytochrome C chaperone family protein [Nisaea acidiphila]|uniref:Ubiquinol-cytochrome C chaperone family protein n=1 Tax=Nisaea acidiphila TaxID=1862145 RepID=A0A9J7AXS4_9PROT|nr:ubiquinol-cytochrome C chaperone family protein [Nisaea acidiphila]UUX50221.1 ubiquinol-cytochrome C chaperone family protein [Nisaea acidiphila]